MIVSTLAPALRLSLALRGSSVWTQGTRGGGRPQPGFHLTGAIVMRSLASPLAVGTKEII